MSVLNKDGEKKMGNLWTEAGASMHLIPYGSVADYQFILNPLT